MSPTGTITFVLQKDATSNPILYTNVVTVNGTGTYDVLTDGDNPGGYRPQVSGSYIWAATYSGDANNFPSMAVASQTVQDCQALP